MRFRLFTGLLVFALSLLGILLTGCNTARSTSSESQTQSPIAVATDPDPTPVTLEALADHTEAAGVAPSPLPFAHPGKIRIVLAGDSTVSTTTGWGPGFAKCFDDKIECVDLALNGRSSKSFIAEGQWKKCLAEKPDYVLIQFGHNDQAGKGSDRETDPQTTYKQFLSQYIDESRAIGAKPVLITSIERRSWTGDGKIKPSLTPQAAAVRELAKAKSVPLIDLNAESIILYEKLGKAAVDQLSATTAQGAVDNTHFNAKGANYFGLVVAADLKKLMPELAAHIK